MKKISILLFVLLSVIYSASCVTSVSSDSDYTYNFKRNENDYYLDWAYCDSDKVFDINKNSGILLVGFPIMYDKMQSRLFEVDLKREFQEKGYKNIVLATSISDFDPTEQDIYYFANLVGCEYVFSFEIDNYWLFDSGGISDANSILHVTDVKSILKGERSSSISYEFVVSAYDNSQSYNSSLVTFNAFMAKQIMNEIEIHLSDEPGSEESQAFFEAGQEKLLEYSSKEPSET